MKLLSLALLAGLVEAAPFQAQLSVDIVGNTYTYTAFNTEPGGSDRFASGIWLTLANTSFQVIGSPSGWDYTTDLSSYVFWFNTDVTPPYPNDIAPGTFLSGFVLESTAPRGLSAYELNSWNHALEAPGDLALGEVQAPTSVPEPGALLFCGAGLAWMMKRGRTRVRSRPLP